MIRPPEADLSTWSDVEAEQLFRTFVAGRPETTQRAYGQDAQAFRQFTGERTVGAALIRLLRLDGGEANRFVTEYVAWLKETGSAPSTINRRLAFVRSFGTQARRFGYVLWQLEVPGVPEEKLRDTMGPGIAGFRAMLAVAAEITQKGICLVPKNRRDVAILRLMFDLALRVGEVVSLDMQHLDLPGGRLFVLGKGRHYRTWFSLPEETGLALQAWVECRGTTPGPLFVSCTNVGGLREPFRRLRQDNAYKLIRALGTKVGITCRPHGIRHAGITRALEVTGGDLRAVQRFSRHKNVQTVITYDDNRADLQGDVARLVAASVTSDDEARILQVHRALDQAAEQLGVERARAVALSWARKDDA